MKQTKRNFWLDVTIFVALLITTSTGILLWLVIPRSLEMGGLGFSRSVWGAAHIGCGVVSLAGIVLHIAWHWGWLKALRGRPLGGMQKKVRANRVVDRSMWITYLATNLFGAAAWSLRMGVDPGVVTAADRLHAASGVVGAILMLVHLALHWRWIASTTQLQLHVNFRVSSDLQKQTNTYKDPI